MTDPAPALFNQPALSGGEVDCVREDGARGEEVAGVVDGCVVRLRGEEGVNEGAFGGVFGDVGLDWEVVVLGEGA